LVTSPVGAIVENLDRQSWSVIISQELLITAFPAFIITYLSARALKASSKKDILKKSIIWTVMLALYYFVLGLGNGNLDLIYTTAGIYVLLICAFLGPLLYSKVKGLK